MALFGVFVGGRTVATIIVLNAIVFALVSQRCPEPYMDEIFHIPQAQRYCNGDFQHWDPKITTLPGTYLVSVLVLKVPAMLWGPEEICTTAALRGTNAFLLGPLACLFTALILQSLHDELDSGKRGALEWRTLRLALMPLQFFFSFLYYTDVASLCFVLLMYLLHRRSWHRCAACAGVIAILVRQPNFIWVNGFALHIISGSDGLMAWISRLWRGFASGVLFFYVAIVIAFGVFVHWNGGLAVGDRQAHVGILHAAMLPYLAAFVLFFLGPAAWLELLGRLRKMTLRAACEGALMSSCFAAMAWYGSYAHPYLLADNRHYVFYLWKNLLRRDWLRCGLMPLILGVVFAALRTAGRPIASTCSKVEISIWALCCTLSTVPAPLLELRYFVIPTVLALLHQPLGSQGEEAAAAIVSAIVNIATVAIFLFRPFQSSDWGDGLQRFMW